MLSFPLTTTQQNSKTWICPKTWLSHIVVIKQRWRKSSLCIVSTINFCFQPQIGPQYCLAVLYARAIWEASRLCQHNASSWRLPSCTLHPLGAPLLLASLHCFIEINETIRPELFHLPLLSRFLFHRNSSLSASSLCSACKPFWVLAVFSTALCLELFREGLMKGQKGQRSGDHYGKQTVDELYPKICTGRERKGTQKQTDGRRKVEWCGYWSLLP